MLPMKKYLFILCIIFPSQVLLASSSSPKFFNHETLTEDQVHILEKCYQQGDKDCAYLLAKHSTKEKQPWGKYTWISLTRLSWQCDNHRLNEKTVSYIKFAAEKGHIKAMKAYGHHLVCEGKNQKLGIDLLKKTVELATRSSKGNVKDIGVASARLLFSFYSQRNDVIERKKWLQLLLDHQPSRSNMYGYLLILTGTMETRCMIILKHFNYQQNIMIT